MPSSPVILAEDVTFGYKNHPVIQHFNGAIEKGQFLGIFGQNGAGKTTFLCSLLGLIPCSGRLTVLGETPRRGHVGIGYVPQWMPELGVAISGKALLAATIRGNRLGLPIIQKRDRDDIEEVIALVNAQHYIDRPFMELSGGERRRLMIAQALLGHPDILLLDEPLANLDPHHQYALLESLEHIRTQTGVTLLLTAHDINPLLSVMTQVLYFARGKAVIGSVAETITSEALSRLYESPIEVIHQKGRIFVVHGNTGQPENVFCH